MNHITFKQWKRAVSDIVARAGYCLADYEADLDLPQVFKDWPQPMVAGSYIKGQIRRILDVG